MTFRTAAQAAILGFRRLLTCKPVEREGSMKIHTPPPANNPHASTDLHGAGVTVYDVLDGRAALAQVLLVTDTPLLGAGVAHLLGQQLRMSARLVVAASAAVGCCLELLAQGRPDLLLVDDHTALNPAVALDVLFKDSARLRLVHGVSHEGPGQLCLHASLATWRQAIENTLRDAGRWPAPAAAGKPLSPRQREVMDLMHSGLSNKEIARHMNLAPGTVKLHVAAVLRALNARNRLQLLAHGTAVSAAATVAEHPVLKGLHS
jgi:DNA-binding NarL/FixJ family response regulator